MHANISKFSKIITREIILCKRQFKNKLDHRVIYLKLLNLLFLNKIIYCLVRSVMRLEYFRTINFRKVKSAFRPIVIRQIEMINRCEKTFRRNNNDM